MQDRLEVQCHQATAASASAYSTVTTYRRGEMGLSMRNTFRRIREVAGCRRSVLTAFCFVCVCLLPTSASAQKTVVKPGWNMFSPQQDVEVGRSVVADAERQLPMLNDPRVDAYLNRLGPAGRERTRRELSISIQSGERESDQRLCASRRVPLRQSRAYRGR